eukprot:TRINITY_DN73742_c0_g1_i1.p1 TRINITY_DN73742_c0_g1~~TRINITY_DN73742_c0_g1_i1.p1  ORF type:complete len:300 (+),score=17.84 TRINITY_DN73742_c0_g1_i1:156-1055(+)
MLAKVAMKAIFAFCASVSYVVSVSNQVLWLPLGDSITFGCTGAGMKYCRDDDKGYRVPLASALSQPPLGNSSLVGFNITTMGTLTTGPSDVPQQWLKHEGHPGWSIKSIDAFLDKSLATSASPPDLVTIHLGTNDCAAGVSASTIVERMHSLLGNLFKKTPGSHVFLADVIGTTQAWNACIIRYNALIPNITSEWTAKGMEITFVPMYEPTGLCGVDGYSKGLCGAADVHPTSAGYPRMASAFAQSIMGKLKKKHERIENVSYLQVDVSCSCLYGKRCRYLEIAISLLLCAFVSFFHGC